jgi:hypothetical protein
MPLYHCKDEGEDVDVQGIHATGLSAIKFWISSNKDHLMTFTLALVSGTKICYDPAPGREGRVSLSTLDMLCTSYVCISDAGRAMRTFAEG